MLEQVNMGHKNNYQQNFVQVTWRLTIFSHFYVNNFGGTLEALLHQPEPQQEPIIQYRQEEHRLPSKSRVDGSLDRRRHCEAL